MSHIDDSASLTVSVTFLKFVHLSWTKDVLTSEEVYAEMCNTTKA